MNERKNRDRSGIKFSRLLTDVVEKGESFPNRDDPINKLNIAYKGKVAIITFELYHTETTALLSAFYV